MKRITTEELQQSTLSLKTGQPSNNAPFSSVSNKPALDVVTFCFAGKQDVFLDEFGYEDNERGYPAVLDKELEDDYVFPAEDLPQSFAYVDYSGKQPRYYVKKNINGFLANPNDQLGNYEKHAKRIGKPTFEYVRVNKSCFKNYLAFLKTKSEGRLSYAQREYNNQ